MMDSIGGLRFRLAFPGSAPRAARPRRRTRWIAAVGIVAISAGCASSLERRFQSHIDYLAADALAGRGVGTGGIDAAGDYIASQFAALGLEPAGPDGTYFQTFPMTLRRALTDATRLSLDGEADLVLQRDYVPFAFSSDDPFEGDVVFAGYAIVAADRQVDDFVHLDVSGKVVLAFRGEPAAWSEKSDYPTHHAMFRNKVYNAKDRGAAAILIVNPIPSAGEADELVAFEPDSADAYGLPAMHISRAVAERVVSAGGLGSLDDLQRRLDSGSYASATLTDQHASGGAGFKRIEAPVRNVMAKLPGEGPLAGECVVIGAHYDHLGVRKPIMRRFRAGKLVREEAAPQIHNGADDNASGVSGLIEIARMFAHGPRPERTVLFVAFTAEESGLHGSTYYTKHPVVPLDHTAAMLNMDMIGRMDRRAGLIRVFGVESGDGLAKRVESAAKPLGLKVATSGDAGGRSDHAPFVRNRVPSLHFFTGQHSDYHQPTDDADKINAAGGARVARFVYHIADGLARADAAPGFHEVTTSSGPVARDDGSPAPSYRVVMGLAPGYGDDGVAGMAVEGVTPDGPADLAGMKPGDRIIRIDQKDVSNIYDYMAATRNNEPGDVVEVVVQRGDRAVPLHVKLAPAR